MAAKRVLGNDPFKRGAAARVPLATSPKAQPTGAKSRPVTPEMQVSASALKGPSKPVPAPRAGRSERPFALGPKPVLAAEPLKLSTEPARASKGGALGRGPVAHAAAPEGTPLSSEPIPHGAAPRGQPLAGTPVAHAGSPRLPADPVVHSASPGPRSEPTPHAASPLLAAEPVPHAATPSATVLTGAPVPHRASPHLGAEPIPHAAAPQATTLSGTPVPHGASPHVPTEPMPHAAAPVGQRLDRGPVAHDAAPTLPAEPIPHAATPMGRPLDQGPVAHDATPEAFTLDPSAPPPVRTPPAAPLAELPRTGPAPSLLSTEGAVTSVQGLAALVRTLVGRASSETRVDGFGRDEALVSKLQPLAEAIYDGWWRVTVEGVEHVPAGPCLLVANHAGALPIDGPVLHHALKRNRPELAPARWLLEDQVFHAPGLGVLWNRLGAVRASPENAHALLEQGAPVIVFPEGFRGLSKPFSERYQLQRFGRGGYVKIAARAGVPIVPVAIVGAEESVPLLWKLPGGALGLPFLPLTLPALPARWFIQFGEPLPMHHVGAEAADDLAWVQRTNDAVRDTIDGMINGLLERRGGVF